MASDEITACWAALVAFVEDVHAPQDQLTEAQWKAAQLLVDAYQGPTRLEDKILFDALATMVEDLPVLKYSDEDWAVAERMLTEYTALVEAAA